MDKPNAGQILEDLAGLYRERNVLYKDNYKRTGVALAAVFPDGVTLRTPDDFTRFHLFAISMMKLSRYAINWGTGHSDSLRDASVYLAMLDSVDADPSDE